MISVSFCNFCVTAKMPYLCGFEGCGYGSYAVTEKNSAYIGEKSCVCFVLMNICFITILRYKYIHIQKIFHIRKTTKISVTA